MSARVGRAPSFVTGMFDRIVPATSMKRTVAMPPFWSFGTRTRPGLAAVPSASVASDWIVFAASDVTDGIASALARVAAS